MASPARILVIEDDAATRAIYQGVLTAAGYQFLPAEGESVGLHLFRTQAPDLVILDLTLADGDGLEICRKIRAHATAGSTPIIVLTGSAQFKTKAEGFKTGADQYLVKPVPPEEVLLWIEALLRRVSLDKGEGKPVRAGDLSVDLENRVVRYKETAVLHLTRKEMELLHYLIQRRPRAVTRKEILSKLWRTVSVDRTVDFHIFNLRKKLPPDAAARIQAVPGKGFRYFE